MILVDVYLMETVQKVKLLILILKAIMILISLKSRVSDRINELKALQVRVRTSVGKYLIITHNH